MPTIESAEEAQQVARLIQEGKLTGEGRESALQALREFDTTAEEPKKTPLETAAGVVHDVAAFASPFGGGGLAGMGLEAARLAHKYPAGTGPVGMVQHAINQPFLDSEVGKRFAASIETATTPETKIGQAYTKLASMPIGYVMDAIGWLGEKAGGEPGKEAAMDAASATMLALAAKGGAKATTKPSALGAHTRQGAVRVLDEKNIPMTLAQRSEGGFAKGVGAGADTVNAIADSGLKKRQVERFTEEVLKNADIKGKTATPDVMGPRADALGKLFDKFDETVATKLDAPFAKKLQTLQKEAQLAPENVQDFVQRHIDHLQVQAAQNGGVIPGAALRMARTALDKATSDPSAKAFASELRSIIDDGVERQAPPGLAKAIRKTRADYRAMKMIEAAVRGNASGLIMPDALWREASTKRNASATIYGKGESANTILARAGAKILGTDPLETGSSVTAVPMSIIGLGALTLQNPKMAAGVGTGLAVGRLLNENQPIARALGGRGSRFSTPLPTKTQALGAYYSASTPEARRQALEELKRAHAPEQP